jgi:putative FmdB family regulatory protein
MPIYEYYCPKCKTEFELERTVSEFDQPVACSKCGSTAKRLISGFASKTGSYLQTPKTPFRGKKAS